MMSDKILEKVVRDNEKLVHFVAKKYKRLDQYDDLVQEGMIGLIKAARRFDPSLGYAFSSYAVAYIKGEILHYLRDRSTVIKTPRNAERISVYSLDVPIGCLETPQFFVDSIAAPQPESDEDYLELKDYIDALSEDRRTLFGLALKRVSNKDIAARLGISPMTVTRRIVKLITEAKMFFEGIVRKVEPTSIPYRPVVNKIIDRIEADVINSVETIFESSKPISKNIWESLKDDIYIAFEAYLKSPSIRSINRCLDSLYLFGLKAIKSKYFYLGSSSDSDSLISWEDLLHESICKVRQYLIDNQINSSSHLIAMLYVFARYACWHEMRRAAKYTSLNKPIKSAETVTLEDFIVSTLSESTPERAEDLRIIESALNQLPPISKQVIELVWIEGKTLTQAAQQMEKPLQFVSQIIQKSRIMIARELTGQRMSLGY